MSGRVYERKFDWDEARRLYADGTSMTEIGRRLGVTDRAVRRVVLPDSYQQHAAYGRSLKGQGVCSECGGPMNKQSEYHGSRRCRTCAALARTTSARDGELLCFKCHEWKPDQEFPMNRAGRIGRRSRHSYCRPCQTIARRNHRHRNKEAERAYAREYKARQRAKQQ